MIPNTVCMLDQCYRADLLISKSFSFLPAAKISNSEPVIVYRISFLQMHYFSLTSRFLKLVTSITLVSNPIH